MFKTASLIAIVLLFCSCNSNIIVSDSKALSGGSWNKDDVIEFTIPELDSLKTYDVYVNIRNTNEYRYSNLFLIVSMNFPNGKKAVDTLEYRMANPDGSWLGNGLGNVKENKLSYKENVSFFEGGNYNIAISHAIRNNGDVDGVRNLEGITDVGYSIEESVRQ